MVSVPLAGVPSAMDAPNEVSEDPVTPDASVVPVRVPAAAVTTIFADPSNDTVLMVRAVASTVADPAVKLAAVPVRFVATPEDGVPRGPPE